MVHADIFPSFFTFLFFFFDTAFSVQNFCMYLSSCCATLKPKHTAYITILCWWPFCASQFSVSQRCKGGPRYATFETALEVITALHQQLLDNETTRLGCSAECNPQLVLVMFLLLFWSVCVYEALPTTHIKHHSRLRSLWLFLTLVHHLNSHSGVVLWWLGVFLWDQKGSCREEPLLLWCCTISLRKGLKSVH